MKKKTYVRGPQAGSRLSPEDSKRLSKLIGFHGYTGAANQLKVSPTLLYKLVYNGSATLESVERMSEALRVQESVERNSDPGSTGAKDMSGV